MRRRLKSKLVSIRMEQINQSQASLQTNETRNNWYKRFFSLPLNPFTAHANYDLNLLIIHCVEITLYNLNNNEARKQYIEKKWITKQIFAHSISQSKTLACDLVKKLHANWLINAASSSSLQSTNLHKSCTHYRGRSHTTIVSF